MWGLVYFRGYNKLHMDDKKRLYSKYFSLQTAAMTNKMRLDKKKKYCGVHIRRGDLSNVYTSYYPQVSKDYFLHAIDFVLKEYNVDEFLLFSDDTQWVKTNIISDVTAPCHVVERNKGYEDLMLLAQCDIIVASQGSFGPAAALINSHCELLVRNVKVTEKSIYAKREVYIA